MTVLFDTNLAPGLPWRFAPLQRSVSLRLGQDALVYFEAENLSDHDVTGHATFNVTPEKAGIYFKKLQCFCFTEEHLAPRPPRRCRSNSLLIPGSARTRARPTCMQSR